MCLCYWWLYSHSIPLQLCITCLWSNIYDFDTSQFYFIVHHPLKFFLSKARVCISFTMNRRRSLPMITIRYCENKSLYSLEIRQGKKTNEWQLLRYWCRHLRKLFMTLLTYYSAEKHEKLTQSTTYTCKCTNKKSKSGMFSGTLSLLFKRRAALTEGG